MLRSLTRNLWRNYKTEVTQNAKSNAKCFWRYINSQLKVRPTISSLKKPDGTVTQDSREIADIFNTYFSSVLTLSDDTSVPTFQLNREVSPITDIDINADIVYNKLVNLKTDKSSGPDGWPILALRETALQISSPLAIIFKKSFQQQIIPDAWKRGHITPIHKKGSRLFSSNYRPVSLISPIVKLMESIIKDSISAYMSNNLFSPSQHGFTARRSCTSQLLCAMNYWTQCLNNKFPVDVTYLDFQKAFDSVSHKYLLSKLYGYGIQGKFLSWIEGFLTGRK